MKRDDLDLLLKRAETAKEDGPTAVLSVLDDLIGTQARDREVASALIRILGEGVLPHDETARLYGEIFFAHETDGGLIVYLGGLMEAARDIDDLNAPPPDDPLFARMIRRLSEIQLAASDPEKESLAAEALARTARLMARQKDDVAERAIARVVALNPDAAWARYSQGLFFKTRGRFAEGVAANRQAIALAGDSNEAMSWNLGICATGVGDGETALGIWRAMGNKLDLGSDGLPQGRYPACKVRLAEHPLAERDAENDVPGLEETIWIERLSPCHGIVRSVLYERDLGVDYGDTVLFDGAPITYHRYGERQIPVFPHLSTLKCGGFRFYDFSATQISSGSVGTANDQLDADTVIYSHTESLYTLCAACWRDETTQHQKHEPKEHMVIHGRIATAGNLSVRDVLDRIDEACTRSDGLRIFAPDLCRAAGQTDRAMIEQRRFDTLSNA
jgi:tetratricopeptide (TPR) repeat protein